LNIHTVIFIYIS